MSFMYWRLLLWCSFIFMSSSLLNIVFGQKRLNFALQMFTHTRSRPAGTWNCHYTGPKSSGSRRKPRKSVVPRTIPSRHVWSRVHGSWHCWCVDVCRGFCPCGRTRPLWCGSWFPGNTERTLSRAHRLSPSCRLKQGQTTTMRFVNGFLVMMYLVFTRAMLSMCPYTWSSLHCLQLLISLNISSIYITLAIDTKTVQRIN